MQFQDVKLSHCTSFDFYYTRCRDTSHKQQPSRNCSQEKSSKAFKVITGNWNGDRMENLTGSGDTHTALSDFIKQFMHIPFVQEWNILFRSCTHPEQSGRLWLFWRAWWRENRCTCLRQTVRRRWYWWSTLTMMHAPAQSCCPLKLDRETDQELATFLRGSLQLLLNDQCHDINAQSCELVFRHSWLSKLKELFLLAVV